MRPSLASRPMCMVWSRARTVATTSIACADLLGRMKMPASAGIFIRGARLASPVGDEGVTLAGGDGRFVPLGCGDVREPGVAFRFEIDFGDFQAVGHGHRLPVDLFAADHEGGLRTGGQM